MSTRIGYLIFIWTCIFISCPSFVYGQGCGIEAVCEETESAQSETISSDAEDTGDAAALLPDVPPADLILRAVLSTTINPASADYVVHVISRAEEQRARAVVIELNTPGGLITSMQSIVEKILSSKVPVIVYVSPSGAGAISAGVFITMAAHVAAMAPGTTIGAAHPVSGDGKDLQDDMRSKAENFTASFARSIAEQRGRNEDWSEKAVRDSSSLTDSQAVTENVVDFIAPSLSDALKQASGRTVQLGTTSHQIPDLTSSTIEDVPMSFRQIVVNAISDPNIMALLGLAAMGGLMAEFYNPGLILPGLVGAICLILSLVAGQVIPINAGGILLVLLGMGLITIETFVPSGLFGVMGTIALVLGAIYAIDTTDVWAADGVFTLDQTLIGSVALAVGVMLVLLGYLVARSRNQKVATGEEGLIGQTGVLTRDLTPTQYDATVYEGTARVMGEIWRVVCRVDGDGVTASVPLVAGDKIRVTAVDGLTLKVVPFS